jgi:hypothetical protein
MTEPEDRMGAGERPDRPAEGLERAADNLERPDADLEHRREHVMHLVRHAGQGWASAMRAHAMAPPDAGFASRLRSLAEAAATEQVAWEQAHAAGLLWRPVPGAERAEPPYELRPGTGRRGPEPMWSAFDAAVAELNRAIARPSAAAVAAGFGDMARSASDLAEAIEREDEVAREAQARARARGVA